MRWLAECPVWNWQDDQTIAPTARTPPAAVPAMPSLPPAMPALEDACRGGGGAELAGGVDEHSNAAAAGRAVDTGDEGGGMHSNGADADGLGLRSHAGIANVDVVGLLTHTADGRRLHRHLQ
jgi:hypothetical protein